MRFDRSSSSSAVALIVVQSLAISQQIVLRTIYENGSLVDGLTALPGLQILMAFSHMNAGSLLNVAEKARDELFHVQLTNTLTTETDLVFVNGQYRPVVPLVAGEWTRLRMVLASVEQQLYITTEGCELRLLAKDGIYLTAGPRAISTIYLAPGNRADVAVRCMAAGTYEMRSSSLTKRRRSLQFFGGNNDGDGAAVFDGVLASIEVTEGAGTSVDLPATWDILQPCYLVDLQQVPVADVDTGFELKLERTNINGQEFVDMETYITTLEVGKVHEWLVKGLDKHPLHIHVNPFQIQSMDPNPDDVYFQVGSPL